jgi:hypothetical protein
MRIHFPFTALLLLLSLTTQAQLIDWAKKIGGAGNEAIHDFALDSQNNIYVTGYFNNEIDFNQNGVPHTLSSHGLHDMFLIKLNPVGDVIWSVHIGGESFDSGSKLVVDSEDNVIVVGASSGMVDLDPSENEHYINSAVTSSQFVSKFNSEGHLQWAHPIRGTVTADPFIFELLVDNNDNIVLIGEFVHELNIYSGEPQTLHTLYASNITSMYVLKYAPNSDLIYANKYESDQSIYPYAGTIDNQDNIYIGGVFSGQVDFGSEDGLLLNSTGYEDAFITKLDANGNAIWARAFGGTETVIQCNTIKTDAEHNIYFSGLFYGTASFQEGDMDLTLTSPNMDNIFVAKLNADGNVHWARRIINSYYLIETDMMVDHAQNTYILGTLNGTMVFNEGPDEVQLSSPSYNVNFLAKYDSEGNFQAANAIRALPSLKLTRLELDTDENIFLAGYFNGSLFNGPVSIENELMLSTGLDGLILKINPTNLVTIDDETVQASILAYPNPAHTHIQIASPLAVTNCEIYDASGSLLSIERRTVIPVEHLPSGVYYLKIELGDKNEVVRFVKQ